MTADSINVQTMTDALAAICGTEYVRLEDGLVSVAPVSTEEVASVMRLASENGITVLPCGSGSKLGWGGPSKAALNVKTNRLNAVKEHTWQDMTCIVEAGCTWAALQAELVRHGQFVALDPLWPEQATVGGIVATNDSGTLRLRYGSLRDLVIGMTIVLADGTIAKTGGKVVKNVAGYDLHKLMTGAMGTLGVVTDVAFRLHSIPPNSRSITIRSVDAEPLGKLLLEVLDSHLSTERMQLRGASDGFRLDIGLIAMAEVLREQATTIAGMAQRHGLAATDALSDVWILRQTLFDQSAAVLLKATMLPTEIAGFSKAVCALGGDCVTQAVGVMTASISVAAAEQIVRLRQQVEAKQGSLTILTQPASTGLDSWGKIPDTMPLMRAIKQRFDPQQILNPGCYLGGI